MDPKGEPIASKSAVVLTRASIPFLAVGERKTAKVCYKASLDDRWIPDGLGIPLKYWVS